MQCHRTFCCSSETLLREPDALMAGKILLCSPPAYVLAISLLIHFFKSTGFASVTCPEGFSKLFSHCLYYSTKPMTQCAAQDFCHSMAGELVTGNKVNTINVTANSWVGASDLLDEGKLRWTDGSLVPKTIKCKIQSGRL